MRWGLAARVAGVGIALITAFAGVVLIDPHLFEIGLAVPQGYVLLGIYLLASSIMSVVCAVSDTRDARWIVLALYFALISLPLFVMAVIDLVLAGQGLLAGRHAIALMAIAAAGALLSLYPRPATAGDEVGPEEVGLTPTSGCYVEVRAAIRSTLTDLAGLLSLWLFGWSIPVGIAFFCVLKALLFGPAALTLVQFLARVADQDWYIFIAILIFCSYAVGEVGSALAAWLRYWGVPDANRLLSLRELGAIETAFEETAEYADRAHYPERDWRMWVWKALAYLLLAGLCVGVMIWFLSLPTVMPDTAQLWFWTDVDHTLSIALSVVTSLLLLFSALPATVLALFWPRFAERTGWQRLVADHKGFAGVTERLLVLMRQHRLASPFEASTFLRREGRRMARLWILLIAVAASATAFAAIHDRAKIDRVGPGGFDIINYRTLRPVHYAFRSVKQIEFQCTMDRNITFHIYVVLPDRDLDLSRGHLTSRSLVGLVAMDEQLRRQRTPIRFLVDKKGKSLYQPACVHAQAAKFTGEDVQRVERLFHLDDWVWLTTKH